MRWFKRTPEPEPEPVEEPIDWSARRKQPIACAGCRRVYPPYVYAENGKDYCVDCAKESFNLMRIRPAGQREGDITLEQLLEDDRAS
jgi:hypothetical protein